MARSQDLVFTLYGDYLRHRGGEAWTGSLIAPPSVAAGRQSFSRIRLHIKTRPWDPDSVIAPAQAIESTARRRWISRLAMQLHAPGPSLL